MGKSTAKGTRYENHVRDTYLQRVWPTAERAAKEGINDHGDFTNVGGFLMEAKWRKTSQGWRVAKWVETAMLKRARKGQKARHGWVVWVAEDKRSGCPIDLAVLPAQDLTLMLDQLRATEAGRYLLHACQIPSSVE